MVMRTVRKPRNGLPPKLASFSSRWAKSHDDLPCLQSLEISCESQFVRWELSHFSKLAVFAASAPT
jgi:hypothetical protein